MARRKYYIVGITPKTYKVLRTVTGTRKDVAAALSQTKKERPYMAMCVRDGKTGKRFVVADFLKAWTHEVKEKFKCRNTS